MSLRMQVIQHIIYFECCSRKTFSVGLQNSIYAQSLLCKPGVSTKVLVSC